MKKIIGILIIILFIINISSFNVVLSQTNNNTVIVDNEGDGDFITIQEAINNAENGDTIEIYSGNYNEIITVNKNLNIIGIPYELGNGNDDGKPIIDANTVTQSAVNINVNSCTFSGFFITRSNFALIQVNSDNNIISDNEFRGVHYLDNYGIYLRNSNYNDIYNNSMKGKINCLYLQSSKNNIIFKNEIEDSTNGIYLNESSNNNIIRDNKIKDSQQCIFIYSSSDNMILNNSFTEEIGGTTTRGILAYFANSNQIFDNYFSGPSWPLSIQYCDDFHIYNNTIESYSGRRGMFLYKTTNTNFSYNYLTGAHWGISMAGENSEDTIISHNCFVENFWTLYLYDGINTLIRKNHFENNSVAITLACTRDTIVEKNNFINSGNEHAYVCWPIWFPIPKPPKNNQFDGNYWDDWINTNPKRIPIRLSFYDAMFPRQLTYYFTYDENPAQNPYDI